MAVRVVVVDDEPMVCAHLRTILGSTADLEVVEEAHDGAAAVEAVLRARPDVVLMDLRMPGVDGLTAIERINKLSDPPVVVALTTFDADQYVLRALRAGAAGFLLKDADADALVTAVRTVASGDGFIAPAVTRKLIRAFAASAPATPTATREAVTALTPRERAVLGCLGLGLSNVEIAERLAMAESTTKTHVSRILAKLGLRGRVQAAILAQELRLPPG